MEANIRYFKKLNKKFKINSITQFLSEKEFLNFYISTTTSLKTNLNIDVYVFTKVFKGELVPSLVNKYLEDYIQSTNSKNTNTLNSISLSNLFYVYLKKADKVDYSNKKFGDSVIKHFRKFISSGNSNTVSFSNNTIKDEFPHIFKNLIKSKIALMNLNENNCDDFCFLKLKNDLKLDSQVEISGNELNTSLLELNLSNNSNLTHNSIAILNSYLLYFKNIRSLNLSGINLSGDVTGFSIFLSRTSSLISLYLNDCNLESDEISLLLSYLVDGKNRSLRNLYLSNNKCDNKSFRDLLLSLKILEISRLNLSGNLIDDESVQGYTEVVKSFFVNLSEIDLRRNKITNFEPFIQPTYEHTMIRYLYCKDNTPISFDDRKSYLSKNSKNFQNLKEQEFENLNVESQAKKKKELNYKEEENKNKIFREIINEPTLNQLKSTEKKIANQPIVNPIQHLPINNHAMQNFNYNANVIAQPVQPVRNYFVIQGTTLELNFYNEEGQVIMNEARTSFQVGGLSEIVRIVVRGINNLGILNLHTILFENGLYATVTQLSFTDCNLHTDVMSAVLIVNNFLNLINLDLSGNRMTDECVELVNAALFKETLITINFSRNNFSQDFIENMFQISTSLNREIIWQ